MKPSEIFRAIDALAERADVAEADAMEHERLARGARTLAALRRKIHVELLAAIDAGAEWSAIETRLAALETEPIVTVEPPHGVKIDGTPKARPGRKARPASEPRKSPLNDRWRAIFEVQFEDGPTTLAAISASTGEAEMILEALLCEDPEAFVSWTGLREGDSAPVMLWGTADQFYQYAANRLTLDAFRDVNADIAIVSERMGCSAAPARAVILRSLASRTHIA